MHQRLVLAGKELEDDKLLSDYRIQQDCQLTLLSRLKGGTSYSSNLEARVKDLDQTKLKLWKKGNLLANL